MLPWPCPYLTRGFLSTTLIPESYINHREFNDNKVRTLTDTLRSLNKATDHTWDSIIVEKSPRFKNNNDPFSDSFCLEEFFIAPNRSRQIPNERNWAIPTCSIDHSQVSRWTNILRRWRVNAKILTIVGWASPPYRSVGGVRTLAATLIGVGSITMPNRLTYSLCPYCRT